MKIVKKILLALVIILIVAQFFGPEKNEGDLASIDAFLTETTPPETVKLILKQSCYNCHSDVTQYPWYNIITPLNYWMAGHIKDGKKDFNMSGWENMPVKRKDHKFEELIEMVENKDMPLPSYTWVHTETKLTDQQIKVVVDWAKTVRSNYGLTAKPE